ncbi:uracil-DNA glycosylase [Stakelama marina]|uniref:Type-5 uracil-DNA glycosylase n=1 Tax=Stakelama marina TaxID=2826939 RepID=A0A8T4IHR7_9SPHN|nr:uracil-DNA glycosylase [Stakelama marina]MBR0552625.1 uracil-DNA glycosylase [Stakelama marina]
MPVASPLPDTEPPHDCPRCPRLVALRNELRLEHPDWWNAPVHAFGDAGAWLGIVGLAPGKHGANRTGRPFTGDYAGDLLYETLGKFGLSNDRYDGRPDDGLMLDGAVIVNAVRCLPPQNKPTPKEINACRPFLADQRAALPQLHVLVALGRIAHDSVLRMFGERLADHPFGHGAEHAMPDGAVLIDSYHCSRYNTNTRRLTPEMFEAVFARALALKPAR